MRKRNIQILTLILFLLYLNLGIASVIINHYKYADVIDSPIYVVAIFMCIDLIYNILKERYTKKSLIVESTILAILIATVIVILPKYTYNSAAEKVKNEVGMKVENVEIVDLEYKNMLAMPHVGFLIDKVYKIALQKDNKKLCFYFNPINGEYSQENKKESMAMFK